MRSHLTPPKSGRMEMTPMIDVTFLILIFFMCTLQFKTLDQKLAATLPRDGGSDERPSERVEPVRLRIDAEGERIVYRVGPLRTLDPVRAVERVAQLVRADRTRQVTVDPRAGVLQGHVVGLLDRLVGQGVQEVSIAAPKGP